MRAAVQRLVCAALLLSACASASAPSSDRAAAPFELHTGVIVDADRGIAYAGLADGTLEAIDVATGRSRWKSADVALPLAADGALLLARREGRGPRLSLAVLDAATGRRVTEKTLALPDGVDAAIHDLPDRRFRVTATRVDGGFRVDWTYREIALTGIAPPRGERASERHFSGTDRVDVKRRAGVSAPPCAAAAAERLQDAQALRQRPWRSGGVFAATRGGRGEPLVLSRWSGCGSTPLPDVVLVQRGVTELPSADERYLLASERVGAGGPTDPEYAWSIFELSSGKRVGGLRSDVSAAPFFVAANRLVHVSRPHGYARGDRWVEVPLQLVATVLTSGDASWNRPLVDVEYRRPLPPAPTAP